MQNRIWKTEFCLYQWISELVKREIRLEYICYLFGMFALTGFFFFERTVMLVQEFSLALLNWSFRN